MKTLHEIIEDLIQISDGLAYGQIQFSFDNLMSAIKPGHPSDFLAEIIDKVACGVLFGKEYSDDDVKTMLKNLRGLKTTFKIKELNKPIKDLIRGCGQILRQEVYDEKIYR